MFSKVALRPCVVSVQKAPRLDTTRQMVSLVLVRELFLGETVEALDLQSNSFSKFEILDTFRYTYLCLNVLLSHVCILLMYRKELYFI